MLYIVKNVAHQAPSRLSAGNVYFSVGVSFILIRPTVKNFIAKSRMSLEIWTINIDRYPENNCAWSDNSSGLLNETA